MSYNTHSFFQSILCPGGIILTSGASVILNALPYHYGLHPSFQPVQITLSGLAFVYGLYLLCVLSVTIKAYRSIVEVVLYTPLCFTCFAAAVPMIVRWRTNALSNDYANMNGKNTVIAFSLVTQSAAAIASLLGLMISAFNRMEIKERDYSIPDEESSFWNSVRSGQSSVRETPNNRVASDNSPHTDSSPEKNPGATNRRQFGIPRFGGVDEKDAKTATRHSY